MIFFQFLEGRGGIGLKTHDRRPGVDFEGFVHVSTVGRFRALELVDEGFAAHFFDGGGGGIDDEDGEVGTGEKFAGELVGGFHLLRAGDFFFDGGARGEAFGFRDVVEIVFSQGDGVGAEVVVGGLVSVGVGEKPGGFVNP